MKCSERKVDTLAYKMSVVIKYSKRQVNVVLMKEEVLFTNTNVDLLNEID